MINHILQRNLVAARHKMATSHAFGIRRGFFAAYSHNFIIFLSFGAPSFKRKKNEIVSNMSMLDC